MDIGFLVTTYNRQESCQRLVDALRGHGDIVVVNDGCDYVIEGCKQHFLNQHNGKAYYWITVKTLFALRGNHKYYFMIPDDYLPVDDMVGKAIDLWKGISDNKKICLNLLFGGKEGRINWTGFPAQERGDVFLSQWVDMCFICESRFFDVVKINEVPYGQASKKNTGSGVGAMISRQLYRNGYNLYQVKSGLFVPQPEQSISQMHDYSHIVSHGDNKRVRDRRKRIVFDTRKQR